MGLMAGCSGLNIVYTSRYFQPCAETFGDRFLFVGPSIPNPGETAGFPWEQVRHRVVVYISLGTLFNTDVAFYLDYAHNQRSGRWSLLNDATRG